MINYIIIFIELCGKIINFSIILLLARKSFKIYVKRKKNLKYSINTQIS